MGCGNGIAMENFIAVKQNDGQLSFGGNQRWFSDETLQKYGCGLVSCGDILLSVKGEKGEISQSNYLEFMENLRKNFFKVRKFFGLNGLSMARGMNRFFRKNNLPYKAKWGVSQKKILSEIEKMLGMGLPVCLSAGPNLHKKPYGLNFFSKPCQSLPAKENVCDHYVTVTDVVELGDEKWLEISSWGKRFFVKISQFMDYKRDFLTFFSNILVISRKISR